MSRPDTGLVDRVWGVQCSPMQSPVLRQFTDEVSDAEQAKWCQQESARAAVGPGSRSAGFTLLRFRQVVVFFQRLS
jgi:hypothetical protein